MTYFKFLATGLMLLTLAACQSATAIPEAGANKADARFITEAFQVIQFDRQEGEIARVQAKDPRVKALAEKLTREADDYAEQIHPLAEKLGIKPPTILREDLRVRLGRMRLQGGLDFDRTYLDDQIASHEEAARSTAMMNPRDYSQPLMGVASNADATVKRNLASLRALRQQIGGPS